MQRIVSSKQFPFSLALHILEVTSSLCIQIFCTCAEPTMQHCAIAYSFSKPIATQWHIGVFFLHYVFPFKDAKPSSIVFACEHFLMNFSFCSTDCGYGIIWFIYSINVNIKNTRSHNEQFEVLAVVNINMCE